MAKVKRADQRVKRIDLRASIKDENNLLKASKKLGTQTISETIFNAVQTVANKSVEYGCDRASIKNTHLNIDYGRAHLQTFITEFFNVTQQYLTLAELEVIFAVVGKLNSISIIENAISEAVKTKLYHQLVKAHPDMIVSFDNVPQKDLTSLFELAGQMDFIPEVKTGQRAVIYWQCYELNEGEISINQKAVDKLTDNYRFTASSPQEIKKLNTVMAICDSLNNALKDPEIDPNHIFSLVYFDSEAKRFSPSGSYIKESLRPNIIFQRYSK